MFICLAVFSLIIFQGYKSSLNWCMMLKNWTLPQHWKYGSAVMILFHFWQTSSVRKNFFLGKKETWTSLSLTFFLSIHLILVHFSKDDVTQSCWAEVEQWIIHQSVQKGAANIREHCFYEGLGYANQITRTWAYKIFSA